MISAYDSYDLTNKHIGNAFIIFNTNRPGLNELNLVNENNATAWILPAEIYANVF